MLVLSTSGLSFLFDSNTLVWWTTMVCHPIGTILVDDAENWYDLHLVELLICTCWNWFSWSALGGASLVDDAETDMIRNCWIFFLLFILNIKCVNIKMNLAVLVNRKIVRSHSQRQKQKTSELSLTGNLNLIWAHWCLWNHTHTQNLSLCVCVCVCDVSTCLKKQQVSSKLVKTH